MKFVSIHLNKNKSKLFIYFLFNPNTVYNAYKQQIKRIKKLKKKYLTLKTFKNSLYILS